METQHRPIFDLIIEEIEKNPTPDSIGQLHLAVAEIQEEGNSTEDPSRVAIVGEYRGRQLSLPPTGEGKFGGLPLDASATNRIYRTLFPLIFARDEAEIRRVYGNQITIDSKPTSLPVILDVGTVVRNLDAIKIATNPNSAARNNESTSLPTAKARFRKSRKK